LVLPGWVVAPSRALSGWRAVIGMAACSVFGMMTSPSPYRGFRFPAEIIVPSVRSNFQQRR
jgi:hypothetical protein